MKKMENKQLITSLLAQVKRAKMTNIDKANLIYAIIELDIRPVRYVSYLLACIHLEWHKAYKESDKNGRCTSGKRRDTNIK